MGSVSMVQDIYMLRNIVTDELYTILSSLLQLNAASLLSASAEVASEGIYYRTCASFLSLIRESLSCLAELLRLDR